MLREVLPRIEVSAKEVEAIVGEKRAEHGIPESLGDLPENPYLLCERYVGQDAQEMLAWSTIDRGVLPSPELGGAPLAAVTNDDARRLRALVVDTLRRFGSHTFLPAGEVIAAVNGRLETVPNWKRHVFTTKYLQVDRDILDGALVQRDVEAETYVYLREAWEDERAIEKRLSFLVSGPDVPLRRPVTAADWKNWLRREDSPLAVLATADYDRGDRRPNPSLRAPLPASGLVHRGGSGDGQDDSRPRRRRRHPPRPR